MQFDALSIEGGLFTADWLGKIATFGAPMQADSDYGVRAGFTLREEIALAWRAAQALWAQFAIGRAAANHDAATVSQRFASELLKQAFGFSLHAATAPQEADGRLFPIGYFAFESTVPVVIGSHAATLDQSDPAYGDSSGERVRRRSAFGLVQEYLNARNGALWGIAVNGLVIRIARDNSSLTRPAWFEADLERLFTEERFDEFSVLWLVAHATRFGGDGVAPVQCVLERWRDACREQGVAARGELRRGVEQALLDLGNGFLAHPANAALRDALATGRLKTREYFQQLLRLVYRKIFLLTVEERGILHREDSAAASRQLYADGYALRRLRDRAVRRNAHDRHDDLWEGLQIVWLGLARGEPRLALPALGGLFAEDQCADLIGARLENRHLLRALFNLAWLHDRAQPNSPLVRVNWRDMGPEELGSIYESLLELEPQISEGNRGFSFLDAVESRGNARKTSGSYYTHDSLVQLLLDSALEPLIAEKLASHPSGEGAAAALLSLTVVDPACGSGHFLLAAARRIATHLARVEAEARGTGQPTPDDYRHALRRAATHCVFGVDLNPMAVELCKTALWLETMDRGRPLSFLDAHIRHGNALIGVHDLAVLRRGIPAEAYGALKDVLADSGGAGRLVDEPAACSALRRRNSAEQTMPSLPLSGIDVGIPADLDAALRTIDSSSEETLDDITTKKALYEQVRAQGSMAWRLQRACDLWTAAFFITKKSADRPGRESVPTSDTVWRFLADPSSLRADIAAATDNVASEYVFFHWPIEFPEVFAEGGFSLVLGNPPWETMSPDAKEFFSRYEPRISSVPPEEQAQLIAGLIESATLRDAWETHARGLYATVRFLKESGRYRMFAPGNLGKGDFNVYRQFVELALNFVRVDGAAAQVVPENFYNGANAAGIRAEILGTYRLEVLFGFENARGVWFDGIDTRMKFAIYVATRRPPRLGFSAAFAINSEKNLAVASLKCLEIPATLVREFSPDALAVMEFSNQLEVDIARKMYSRFPRLGAPVADLPEWLPATEMHMGNDRGLFTLDAAGLPLYQGSMVGHHDYRAKAYVSGHGRNTVWEPLGFGDPRKAIRPQWRVLPTDVPSKARRRIGLFRVGFCDVGNATNQRSLMAALIPPGVVCGHKVPTVIFSDPDPTLLLLWLGVANSLVMDFIVRMKVALTMSLSLLETLPFPRRVSRDDSTARVVAMSAQLSGAGPEMRPLVEELRTRPELSGFNLSPVDNASERASLAAELEVVVARDLYGLTRREITYLLEPKDVLGSDCTAETFAALRRAEEREFGEYRTRRLVLEAWDRLALPQEVPA